MSNVEDITRLDMSNYKPTDGAESIESVRKGYNQIQFLNVNNSVDRVQEGSPPIMLNKIDKTQQKYRSLHSSDMGVNPSSTEDVG